MNTSFSQNIQENIKTRQKLDYLLNHLRKPTVIWIATDDREQLDKLYKDICRSFANRFQHIHHNLLSYTQGSFTNYLADKLPKDAYTKSNPLPIVHLWNVESWTTNDTFTSTPFLENINFERDSIFKELPFVLIFWSNTLGIKQLQRYALDFVDYLTYTFVFFQENEKEIHNISLIGDNNTVIQGVNNSNLTINHHYSPSNEKETPSFPRFHNTSATPLPHEILGRTNDLRAVYDKLQSQKQCVVLNGLGGIGKSSLAKLYIQQYHTDYQHIIWLYEKANAADILLTDIDLQLALQVRDKVLQCLNAQDERGAIATIIAALNELPEPVLLIADNVTDLKAFYTMIQHLDKNHYHILFTSRQETTTLPFHKLNILDKVAAFEVFMLHYNGTEAVSLAKQIELKNNPALPLILKKIQYHTLTIELYAKILRNSNTLTPEKLLARIEEQLLVPKITQSIDTAYTKEQATLLTILLTAFDISNIAQQTTALDILAQWAVLPATPIPHTHLLALLGITNDNEDAFDAALTFLIHNAWIQKITEEENNYACHALIQEAVRWQLDDRVRNFPKVPNPIISDSFNYDPLIERLYWLLHTEAGDNPLEKAIWLPYSASILSHLTAETESLATLNINTAFIYEDTGNLDKALEYGLKYIVIMEKKYSSEHLSLANAYNNIAEIYRVRGDLFQSLKYGLKSMAIREKFLSPQHLNLATSYNNIALTYQAMGDLPKALAYGLKNIEILKKNHSPEHPHLATSYNNIAITYKDMGDLPKSLEYGLKSMTIREKILSPKHPDLATSYNNLAGIYQAIGNLPKSLEYGFKSMEIREKALSLEHPDLAASYNNIARTYYYLQIYLQSLAYLQKAIQIWRKSLPKGHANTKNAINGMAVVLQAAIDSGHGEEVEGYIAWYESLVKA